MHHMEWEQLDDVAGGLVAVWRFIGEQITGWGIGAALDAASAALGDHIANGGAPDYSRTTVMGDMY